MHSLIEPLENEGGPNSKWTTHVTDVEFISAQLLYVEEGVSDSITF